MRHDAKTEETNRERGNSTNRTGGGDEVEMTSTRQEAAILISSTAYRQLMDKATPGLYVAQKYEGSIDSRQFLWRLMRSTRQWPRAEWDRVDASMASGSAST